MRTAGAIAGADDEITVFSHHGFDPLVLADVQVIMLGNFAVVLQSFLARGLLLGGGEGDVSDLQQLRRGEKEHALRVVIERVHQASLVEDDDSQANLLRFDGAGQACGTSADDEHIAAHLRTRLGPGLSLGFEFQGGKEVRHGVRQGRTRGDGDSSTTRKR